MIDKLYDYYFGENQRKKLRLCDIFEEWLSYKRKKKQNSEQTVKQNRASYIKYVKGTELDSMSLAEITTFDLEDWSLDVLSEHKLTAKAFNTHKIVVTGPLTFAKRRGYIKINPWLREELEYSHLFRSERIKKSAEMLFYPDEIKDLFDELDRGFESNGNITNLGLKFNFELGLRVGELCALKWQDIDWKNETLFIQRMEDSSGRVVEQVKSDSHAGYRELYLTDEAVGMLKKIRRDSKVLSEFIFSNDDGSRAGKMQFEHRLTKAELAMGWETGKLKYSHCIRRTVASHMDVNGYSLEEIRAWLGHTNKETTLKYIFNPYRESETKKKVKRHSIIKDRNCLQLSSKKASTPSTRKAL